MKKAALSVLVFCCSLGVASAEVLPKNVLRIKEAYDKVGATACSQALAEVLSFVTKGKGFANNRYWSTSDPNRRPISMNFVVEGTKSDLSMIGYVYFAPVGGKCHGGYTYTTVFPGANCKDFIQREGFDERDGWKQTISDDNGDGGLVYFLESKETKVDVILNDVSNGCSLSKHEEMAK